MACIIGDGEAETGALAASWHSNKFLNPARDGAILSILHLNGFKIANPTVLARIERGELINLIRGYGYEPHFVDHTFVHIPVVDQMCKPRGVINARDAFQALLGEAEYDVSLLRDYVMGIGYQ